ncbi:MAG: hypothetical protein ACK2U3_08450 [Anaerolineales bacterium]|jgi:hypothetical protein
MKYWSLRQELYNAFHQWPQMILFFLIGGLIGMGIANLIPVSHRATSQLYVALNPYRAYSDSNFTALANPNYSNLDDYKNWQMSELESLVFLDAVIGKTLDSLQSTDPFWQDINGRQLREMLDADWRSAGTWSLNADHPNPKFARQAVEEWSGVILEQVADSTRAALETALVDEELQALISAKSDRETRLSRLASLQNALNSWEEGSADLEKNQPLTVSDRWYLQSLAASAADFSPGWLALLDQQPGENDSLSVYAEWVAQILTQIEIESAVIQMDISELAERQTELEAMYEDNFSNSYGLSPNIYVEKVTYLPSREMHPTSLYILVGGLIGLLVWLFYRLILISRKQKDST